MRAVLLSVNEIKQPQVTIEGDRFRHLTQVTRTKAGDDFLVLDGCGYRACATLSELGKKSCVISLSKLDFFECPHTLSLLIGCPKKDAVEEILRRSVELGIKNLYFYESQYSQWIYSPHVRFDKIIESALIQSNNFWAPKVKVLSAGELSSTLRSHQRVLWMHLDRSSQSRTKNNHNIDLICVGPEAGWSAEECDQIKAISTVEFLQLDTPILRAEHAISVASGYALAINDI